MTPRAVPGLTVCHSCAGEGSPSRDAGRAAQLETYALLDADGLARLATVDCLDQCGRGDAIAVRPMPAQRHSTPTAWLAGVTSREAMDALRVWLAAGGPGRADLPPALARHAVPAPGEAGSAAE